MNKKREPVASTAMRAGQRGSGSRFRATSGALVSISPSQVYDDHRRMRLKIVQVGEAVLRQQAKALSVEEIRSRETQDLIEWMRETMHDAPGVGLAAPQIGLGLQLAVIEDKAEYHKNLSATELKERERGPIPFHVIINPEIELLTPPEVSFHEGCLSVPGFMAVV